jgi:hypothetical protein
MSQRGLLILTHLWVNIRLWVNVWLGVPVEKRR